MGWFRHRRAIRICFTAMVILLIVVLFLRQQQIGNAYTSKVIDALGSKTEKKPDSTDSDAENLPASSQRHTVHDFEDKFSDSLYENANEHRTSDAEKITQDSKADKQAKKTPLDADHVSTVPSEFHAPKLNEPAPKPVTRRPPEMDPITIVRPSAKYEKLYKKLPTSVEKFCHLPYRAPRTMDARHLDSYRLLASYQLITPGLSAPPETDEAGQLHRINKAIRDKMDCSLEHAEGSERLRLSFIEFRDFLKTMRNDKTIGEYVRVALRSDGECDPGQLTPTGIVYHFELGELLARNIIENERLLNSPYEEEEEEETVSDSESDTHTKSETEAESDLEKADHDKWVKEVRHAVSRNFYNRVRSRAVRSQAAVIGALATMYSIAKRLQLPADAIRIEIVDYTDRYCMPVVYRDDDANDKKNAFLTDCDCPAREVFAEEIARARNAQIRLPVHDMESRQFNRYRELIAKMSIAPAQYEDAARAVLASTCDQLQADCYSLKKGEADVCFKMDEVLRLIDSNEYLEWKWSTEPRTLTHAVLNTYPYFLDLVQTWTNEIAGIESGYKMLDTSVRSAKKASQNSHSDENDIALRPRQFLALNLDFVDVKFLTQLRRMLNVSNLGLNTKLMGFGQRMSFELYESLQRSPGEVLVRISDADRELTQKSSLMCPKTYGDGLCQLSRIHEYVFWDLVYDTTGNTDFNQLCKPLKPINVEL